MKIKILGTGCKKCESLKENTEVAVKEVGVEVEIIKVTDLQEIMSFGIMKTPALVIDEKVVSVGKVLKPNEIINFIQKTK